MSSKQGKPWFAQQNWEDILFIHKPVNPEHLKSFIPYPFEIDLYNNKAWVSIVLFRAKGSRLRFMPSYLSFPPYYQMNLRTYVRFGNERGVYFFKIHASNKLVNLAGNIVALPFSKANMVINKEKDKLLFKAKHLFNQRESKLSLTYKAQKKTINPSDDSLAYFLTERYAVLMIRDNSIIKAPIFHTPWNLNKAKISILDSKQMPFSLANNVVTHYANFKHTLIYPLEIIGKVSTS